MSDQAKQTRWLTAIAVVGAVVAGVLGLLGVFLSYLSRDFSAFGLCTLAAAVAFGLLGRAVLKE